MCTDHPKHSEDKKKSCKNAADALLERFTTLLDPSKLQKTTELCLSLSLVNLMFLLTSLVLKLVALLN